MLIFFLGGGGLYIILFCLLFSFLMSWKGGWMDRSSVREVVGEEMRREEGRRCVIEV